MRQVPPDDIRTTNTERRAAADRLVRACGDGSLDLAEFETRVAAAWAATTRGDLARLTADLPNEATLRASESVRRSRRRIDRAYRALRGASVLWLIISTISVAIWLLSCVGQRQLVYPWCVWVVGPAGGALAGLWFCLDGRANPNGHQV